MLDKHITRLMKSDNGEPTFESITDVADVIKLAGRGRRLRSGKEFGVSADRMAALDRATALAIAAGIDALRDAGIPLVMRYKTTTRGTQLPDRWGLPDSLARRYGRDLRLRFSRATTPLPNHVGLLHRPGSPPAVGHAGGLRASSERQRTLRPGPADRPRIDELRTPSSRAIRLRPALPVPYSVDGTLAVCRVSSAPAAPIRKSTPPAPPPRRL